MKTTPLTSLAACAGLLLSGCQSKNPGSPNPNPPGKPGVQGSNQGIINVVWAQGSPHLPVKWYVDGKDAGIVPGSKSVTREKHWVYYYNLQTHSAFTDKSLQDAGKAILVDLSSSSGKTEKTIEVTASNAPSHLDNNAAVLAPYGSGTGATGQISTVWKAQQNCPDAGNVIVDWWREWNGNDIYVGTVPSTATGLARVNHYVHFYNRHDNTFFPSPSLLVRLKPSPNERDAKVKVCVELTP
jgi:hypothetical protein